MLSRGCIINRSLIKSITNKIYIPNKIIPTKSLLFKNEINSINLQSYFSTTNNKINLDQTTTVSSNLNNNNNNSSSDNKFKRAKIKVNTKPLIAIIGKPNVGKSTLFNRVVQGHRQALVENIPGTTRDRYYSDAFLYGCEFQLVDTGGLVGEAAAHTDRFSSAIKEQATVAMDEADSIIFLLDAKTGITPVDRELARMLRNRASTTGQKVYLGINKADSDQLIDKLPNDELIRLGFGKPYAFSAIHGSGVLTLFEDILKELPEPANGADLLGDPQQHSSIKISIVGQPNAGKSSLLNQIIGEERSIVSDVAGTTHDPVDCQFLWRDQHDLTLIDTAGIRRRSTHKVGLEKSSVLWAIKAIERSQVVLMVIDATVGITDQDLKIADFIVQNNKSVMILVNKWDLYAQNKKRDIKMADKRMFQDNQEKFKPTISLLSDILDDNQDNQQQQQKSNRKSKNKKQKEIVVEELEEQQEEEVDNEIEDDIDNQSNEKDRQLLIEKNSSELDFTSDFWPESVDSKEQKTVDDIEKELESMEFDEDDNGEEDRNEQDETIDEDMDEEEIREQKFIQAYWKYMKQLEKSQSEGMIPRSPPPQVELPTLTKEQKEYESEIRSKLKFLDFAPIIFTSAKTGFCVPTALDMAVKIFFEREKRLKIKELMNIIKQATFKHKLPKKGKGNLRIKFASQSKGFPPSFVFFVNDPDKVQPSFLRYILNSIRETYPFVGTPISIYFRRNKKRLAYKKRRNK